MTKTDRLPGLLDALGLEIVSVQPGSDQGQFPILDLLGNLRDESAGKLPLLRFQAECTRAWDRMVKLVEAGKPFSTEDTEWLHQLLTRLQSLGESVLQRASATSAPGPVPEPPAQPIPELLPARESATQPKAEVPAIEVGPKDAPAPASPPPTLEEEAPIQLNAAADGELLREFITESREHLDNIEQGVLVLENQPSDAETLNTVFRAFHSFKGGAGFLNLVPINRLAHVLESLLDLARQHKLTIDASIIELILHGGDVLKKFVDEIDGQINGTRPAVPIAIPTAALKAQVQATLDAAAAGTLVPRAPAPEPVSAPAPAPAATAEGTAPASTAAPVSAPAPAPAPTAKPAPVVVESTPTAVVPAPVRPPAPTPTPASTPSAGPASATATAPVASATPTPATPATPAEAGGSKAVEHAAMVKVDTVKLDGLLDLVGEMVIAQSLVGQDLGALASLNPQSARNVAQLGRITRELQRVSMSMRMVPIRGLFQKMARVVRDIAAKHGKKVQFVTDGEDTELDRSVVEELNDPLLHMVRNSMDHGIELPEARAAAGKSPVGRLCLRAYHQGGSIVVEIEDDGAGLNKERILQKAVERGLTTAATPHTDEEVFAYIFAAGFSTAQQVTDLSGRGVGLDVVRRNIERLRGCVDISSTQGKGTLFKLTLPLTLAIIDGLIVKVGEERYVIPTLSVRGLFRPQADMITRVHNRAEVVKVRDRLVPLLRLRELFGVQPTHTDPTEGIVVVAQAGASQRCLLVDALLHIQEVVIKNINDMMVHKNRALAGAAILGDGRVGLILDVNALVQLDVEPIAQAA